MGEPAYTLILTYPRRWKREFHPISEELARTIPRERWLLPRRGRNPLHTLAVIAAALTRGPLVALLCALVFSGCMVCHAPPKPKDVPKDVEVAAFVDQRECWTVEMLPGAELVASTLVEVLKLVVPQAPEDPRR
jgi:hypothetical protein